MALMAETATEETSTKKGRGVTLWPHSGGERDGDDDDDGDDDNDDDDDDDYEIVDDGDDE